MEEKEKLKLLTIEEMCDILQVGRNCAYELLQSGQIKAFRIGRIWKIPYENVKSFIFEMANQNAVIETSNQQKIRVISQC